MDFTFSSNGHCGMRATTGGSGGGNGLPKSSLDVVAHNGRLLDNGNDGLNMITGIGGGAGKATMTGLHCVGNRANGLFISCPATIENSVFANNFETGLRTRHTKTGHVTLLKRVEASRNGNSGIRIDSDENDPNSMILQVVDAVSTGNAMHGMLVNGSSTTDRLSLNFEEIKITYNGLYGVRVQGGSSSADCDVSMSSCDSVGNNLTGIVIEGTTGGGGLPPGAVSVVASGGRCEDNNGDGMLVSHSSGAGGGAGKVSVQDFHFTRNSGNGLSTDCPASIEDSDFSSNGQHGLKLNGKKEFKGHVTLLKRLAASSNGGNGIDVDTDGTDVVMDLHVQDAVCSSNDGNGIHVVADEATANVSLTCARVSANNNGAHGMRIAQVAMDKGMRFSADQSSFSLNAVSGLTVDGSPLDTCTVSSSEACGNGENGMSLAGKTVHFVSNTASGNSANGVSVASSLGGVVRDNTCSGNTERGITINTSHVEYASNRCVSNGVYGIEVAGGSSNVLRGNFVSGNADAGIALLTSNNRLYENSGGSGTNPLYEGAPDLINDISPPAPAAIRGGANIGF
jgi:parallel beta-helix repeat protein